MAIQLGPPPGWYPHPAMAGTLCYWTGSGWSDHLAPMPAQRPGNGEVSDTVQTIGWVCAFVFPIVGFVIGCLCVSQGPKHDGWMITAVSAIFGLFGLALIVASAVQPL